MSRLDTYVHYNKILNALEKLLQEESFCNAIDALNLDAAYNTLKDSIGNTGMPERIIVQVFLNEIINSLGEQEFIDSDMSLPKTYFNIWNEFVFEDELIITDRCKLKFKGNTFEGRVVIDCDVPKGQFSLVTFKKDVLFTETLKHLEEESFFGCNYNTVFLPKKGVIIDSEDFIISLGKAKKIYFEGSSEEFSSMLKKSSILKKSKSGNMNVNMQHYITNLLSKIEYLNK